MKRVDELEAEVATLKRAMGLAEVDKGPKYTWPPGSQWWVNYPLPEVPNTVTCSEIYVPAVDFHDSQPPGIMSPLPWSDHQIHDEGNASWLK